MYRVRAEKMWREVKTMFSQNRCLPGLHFLLLYFSFRFITPDDEQWFNTQRVRSVEENVSPDVGSYILPEPYFVDFLREMPEPTGDEPEDTTFEVPKVYELVFIFRLFRSLIWLDISPCTRVPLWSYHNFYNSYLLCFMSSYTK